MGEAPMLKHAAAAVLAVLFVSTLTAPAQTAPPASTTAKVAHLTIPAGTELYLVNTRAVWMKDVRTGNPLYLQAQMSLQAGNAVAIPAGTWVQATVTAVTLPSRKVNQAALRVRFDKLIFPNGYTVTLATNRHPAPLALITIAVSSANDLLLDNGTQLALPFSAPLRLNAQQVAQAAPLASIPGPFKPGTLCRDTPFIPGSPGTADTPDTIIPGSPGTPDIVIPGMNGAPDTVIPGIPATPDTNLHNGTPGSSGTADTPATFCPPPPIVVSSVPQ